jgi:hypothetical protein
MAWRINESVTRAEFDFRVAGKVLGRLWLNGLEEPVVLRLSGTPEADLRGQTLLIHNPKPSRPMDGKFAMLQEGQIGTMTASKKVKILDCEIEEMSEHRTAGRNAPWHWGNSVYLEWFSAANGRVLFESAEMELRMNDAVAVIAVAQAEEEEDEDAPTSQKEAEAETYAEYMNTLVERVALRLEDETSEDDYNAIFSEERKKLRRQYGMETLDYEDAEAFEEEDEIQAGWVSEVLEHYSKEEDKIEEQDWVIEDEFAEDFDDEEEDGEEDWDEDMDSTSDDSHPLVNACLYRSETMHRDMQENQWLPEICQEDHPLDMLHESVMFAGVKLSSALMDALEEWPPPPSAAGHVLVGLKAARRKFRDALLALQCCLEEGLAKETWLREVEVDVRDMLEQVTGLIEECRAVLAGAESDE